MPIQTGPHPWPNSPSASCRQIVDSLKQRAAANSRSAEAEHREILRHTLLRADGNFADRARDMRQRFSSSIDSTDTIRADRYRDGE